MSYPNEEGEKWWNMQTENAFIMVCFCLVSFSVKKRCRLGKF